MSFAAVAVGVGSAVAGAVVTSAMAPSPGAGSSGAAQADPFASQRGQYQTMLQNLITNPDSVTQTAMYKTGMEQGTAAVNQGEAASGYLNSGNRGTALQTFGQNYATTAYNNQATELNLLSGANTGSPGTAGQLTNQQTQQQQAAAGTVGNAVGSAVGTVANGYMNSGFSGTTGFNTGGGGAGGAGSNAYNFNSGVSDPSYGVSYGFGV